MNFPYLSFCFLQSVFMLKLVEKVQFNALNCLLYTQCLKLQKRVKREAGYVYELNTSDHIGIKIQYGRSYCNHREVWNSEIFADLQKYFPVQKSGRNSSLRCSINELLVEISISAKQRSNGPDLRNVSSTKQIWIHFCETSEV